MQLIEIFLPLFDNVGARFSADLYGQVRAELVQQFGGLTAFSRTPAEGLWIDDGETSKDEIVIFEVMVETLNRGWWETYRKELERRFAQEVILIRSSEVHRL